MNHHWNKGRHFICGSFALTAFLLLTACGEAAPATLKQTATPTVSTSPTATSTPTPKPREARGTVKEFVLPNAESGPFDITAGPDGNLWFTQDWLNQIGQITPTGVVTQMTLPDGDSRPQGITVGPEGNLWFTESTNNRVGWVSPGP